jgi:hypothetical protein
LVGLNGADDALADELEQLAVVLVERLVVESPHVQHTEDLVTG